MLCHFTSFIIDPRLLIVIKFRYTLILLLIISFSFTETNAQFINNLDFEERGNIIQEYPAGWFTFSSGQSVYLDSLVYRKGKFSLKSELISENNGMTMIRQEVPKEHVFGKKMALRGWIKSEKITTGMVNLWIRTDTESGNIGFQNLGENAVDGTTSWTQYEIEMSVEEDVTSITLGAVHEGNGTVWFDDFELVIDDEIYNPDAHRPRLLTEKENAWLTENAIPLSTDEPNSGFQDLKMLTPIFSDAQIIGLGEGTHGTREFFRMKHRFIEWFASQEEPIIFAIEASMPEARIVNDYVLKGNGDPKEALAGMHFWTWNTEEILDLIEWMRDFNESGDGKIEFWGFDMQFPGVAVDSVSSFINQADPTFSDKLEEAYSLVGTPAEIRSASRDSLKQIYDIVAEIRPYIEENRERYLREFDTMEIEWAIQYARIVEQSISRYLPDHDIRDVSMGKNIEWIYNQKETDGRVIVWAHNAHIDYSTGMMGDYLSNRFGENYKNVGFAFGEGSFMANGPHGLKPYTDPYPMEGSVEHALRSTGVPIFALDLVSAKKHDEAQWLSNPRPFRSIGSGINNNPYFLAPVSDLFDLLIYFDKTTESNSLGRP